MHVCVCVCACESLPMFVCVHVCIHLYMHTHSLSRTHTRTRTHMYMHTHTLTYVHMYMYTFTQTHSYAHTHTNICIYIYIYTRTHQSQRLRDVLKEARVREEDLLERCQTLDDQVAWRKYVRNILLHVYVPWFMHVCDVTRAYVWLELLTRATWLIQRWLTLDDQGAWRKYV